MMYTVESDGQYIGFVVHVGKRQGWDSYNFAGCYVGGGYATKREATAKVPNPWRRKFRSEATPEITNFLAAKIENG